MPDLRDRYTGCFLGLAAGDALGAPVEFFSARQIRARYGAGGIREMDTWGGFDAGCWTDDTQMSLATARGILAAHERGIDRGIYHPPSMVYEEYKNWLASLADPANDRFPGRTCVGALRTGKMGQVDEPLNESKGCGGVMRVAPAGLAYPPEDAWRYAAAFAAITHGHPSAILPSAFLAALIAHIEGGEGLEAAIGKCRGMLSGCDGHEETSAIVELAVTAAGMPGIPAGVSGEPDSVFLSNEIAGIGEGWTGEEALAIALFCALRFQDSFEDAVAAAANHGGDSDSTASICGAIMGTLLGARAIPERWLGKLEKRDEIDKMGDTFYRVFALGQAAFAPVP
ncbi:MAG: ADP-ribosylglycohydrolase family protein [bacterium]